MVSSALADLWRERFVDAKDTGVRIDCIPDRLTGLACLGEHVPVVPDALEGGGRRPVERNIVLAGATMPDSRGTLPASCKILPERILVRTREPVMRKLDRGHGASDRRYSPEGGRRLCL